MDFKYGIRTVGTYNHKSVYKVPNGYLIGVGNVSLQSSKNSLHWAYRHEGKYAGAIMIPSANDAHNAFIAACKKVVELQGTLYRTKRVFPLATSPKYFQGVLIPSGMQIVNRLRKEKRQYLEARVKGPDGYYTSHHVITSIDKLLADIEIEKAKIAAVREAYLRSIELSFDEAVFLYKQNPVEVCPRQQYQDHLNQYIGWSLNNVIHSSHSIQEYV